MLGFVDAWSVSSRVATMRPDQRSPSWRRPTPTVRERRAGAALVKGGHLAGAELVDVLYDGVRLDRYVQHRIETRAGHGTGCTLSSAIVASLALGDTLSDAVAIHRLFVEGGSGRGPV